MPSSPSPSRQRLLPPAAIVAAVVACLATYGAGFGLGHVIKGSPPEGSTTTTSSSSSSTTRPPDPERLAVDSLEQALKYGQKARIAATDEVDPVASGHPCTDASSVAATLSDDVIGVRSQGISAAKTANRLVPGGFDLARRLVAAYETNNQADQLRLAWLKGPYALWQSGGCQGAAPLSDLNYQRYATSARRAAGQRASFAPDFDTKAGSYQMKADWAPGQF